MQIFLSEVECGSILTVWQKKIKSPLGKNGKKQIIYNITYTAFSIQIEMCETSQVTLNDKKQTKRSVNRNRLTGELDLEVSYANFKMIMIYIFKKIDVKMENFTHTHTNLVSWLLNLLSYKA